MTRQEIISGLQSMLAFRDYAKIQDNADVLHAAIEELQPTHKSYSDLTGIPLQNKHRASEDYSCYYPVKIDTDSATGEETTAWYGRSEVLNKDNKCRFFHKRLLAPNRPDNRLCKHCTHFKSRGDMTEYLI